MNKYQKLFTKIIKSGSVWTYLLRDEFNDTVAAGSVNNTLATDGVNTRTVTDTTLKLFIGGGNLSLSGNLTPSYAEPSLQYANIVRAAGVVALFELTKANASGLGRYGWWSDINGSLGVMPLGNSDIYFIAPSTWTPIGTFPQSASVIFALALRASGEMIFINTGSGWKLIFVHEIHSGNVRMSYRPYDDSATSKYVRVAGYWLPAPLVSDGFSNNGTSDGLGHAETSGIGSGGSGVVWSGTTWSVSGGKAINTPGLGSNVVVNGDFATDTVWTKGVGWTISSGTAHITSASTGNLTQTPLTVGAWYQSQFTVSNYITGYVRVMIGGSGEGTAFRSANGTQLGTGRCIGSATLLVQALNATLDVDNVSCKALALSDLLSLHTSFTPDVFTGIDITVVAGTQAGLALNWDSASSPANGVIAYHDGTNCKLEKCVAGTWTPVINAAATYSANARLVVSKIGTAYRLYYNNALVGSGTISDAGIVSNTKHGLFSTDSSNTLDNFVVYASGSNGEYSILNSI